MSVNYTCFDCGAQFGERSDAYDEHLLVHKAQHEELLDARATITRQAAEIEKLRGALRRIGNGIEDGESFSGTYCGEIARAALSELDKENGK